MQNYVSSFRHVRYKEENVAAGLYSGAPFVDGRTDWIDQWIDQVLLASLTRKRRRCIKTKAWLSLQARISSTWWCKGNLNWDWRAVRHPKFLLPLFRSSIEGRVTESRSCQSTCNARIYHIFAWLCLFHCFLRMDFWMEDRCYKKYISDLAYFWKIGKIIACLSFLWSFLIACFCCYI